MTRGLVRGVVAIAMMTSIGGMGTLARSETHGVTLVCENLSGNAQSICSLAASLLEGKLDRPVKILAEEDAFGSQNAIVHIVFHKLSETMIEGKLSWANSKDEKLSSPLVRKAVGVDGAPESVVYENLVTSLIARGQIDLIDRDKKP